MFDIGFWELCLIAVIALLVFGPEKLPGAARTAGLWIGRARRFIGTVKQDIDKELHLQEMQDAIKQSGATRSA
ncbi:MAG: Sec-independent protein translocase protein TatB [Pseudomonadota bacterium]